MGIRSIQSMAVPVACLLLVLMLAGCAIFGIAAQALPNPRVAAAYKGLEDQTAAVMVWADRGVRTDFPPIQLDAAESIQSALQQSRAKEVRRTEWPVEPRSIVRYQRDYPQIEMMSITQVAPSIGVSRLIYIEIEDFRTRANTSVELYRGSITATLKVIEVEADGTATVAYEENDVRALFPRQAPEDGITRATDELIYHGTIREFTQEVVKRFITHEGEW